MGIWHFGNTSVRSPFRLRDGLIALSKSSLQGDLHGREQEIAFRDLLGDNGIVTLGHDSTYSVSRKWRSALDKMGFIYPKITKHMGFIQSDLGDVATITPNGWRLIKTESFSGWQECFLRSLAAFYIQANDIYFSPLRFTLHVMISLEATCGESKLNMIEFSLFVQLENRVSHVKETVSNILDFRKQRSSVEKKRDFDRKYTDSLACELKCQSQTLKDYGDLNFRYLKATGLVQSKGHGIALAQSKRILISKLICDTGLPENDFTRLKSISNGAALPLDEKDNALLILEDQVNKLKELNVSYNLSDKILDTPQDIAVVRHDVEEIFSQLEEIQFASLQSTQSEEISAFMELLCSRKNQMTLSNGDVVKIPRGEAPAYFEWVVWRVFLAINSLVNQPWEARKFKIDQDFLPVFTAPGNGPDLVFEFDDMVLIVEVTLTSSSRQEAAEGEPVRRHVAKYAEDFSESGKLVFGLFIAVKIDTNTANTFRLGEWYLQDDRKIDLHIVPIVLKDFINIWKSAKDDKSVLLPKIKELLRDCRMFSNKDAPEWKQKIVEISEGIFLK